jgi:Family of unknown function (DUF6228)
MDALVLASRTGVRLELVPAPWPYDVGEQRQPTWMAKLTGGGLDASVVCPEAGWAPQALAGFFATPDADWRGWDGDRIWRSEESELTLTARHDKVSTVLVTAAIEDGTPPRWLCEAVLEVDPGVFIALSGDARRLERVSLSL